MSRARRYRGVVFDLDGTLLDSMPLVLSGLAAAVTPYRPTPDPIEVMAALGGPSDACVLRLLGSPGHLREALAAYLKYLDEHEDGIRPFPGARRLLADLASASLRLGLWTGRERNATLARLGAVDLLPLFEPLVCGDDLATHKPDPEGMLQILERWGCRPDEVVFVGDSDQDLAGGVAAGVPVVVIHHGRSMPAGLLRSAEAVFEKPPEAYAWLRRAVLPASPPI